MRRNHRQIEVARFLDRLATIHRFEDGQLAGAFLQDARDAEEIFAALAPGHFSPHFIVGAPRGAHGAVDILLIAQRDLGKFFLRGRVDGVEILSAVRGDKLPIDELFVARRDLHPLAVLGRGSEVPLAAEVEATLLERHDGVRLCRGDDALLGDFAGEGFEFRFHE